MGDSGVRTDILHQRLRLLETDLAFTVAETGHLKNGPLGTSVSAKPVALFLGRIDAGLRDEAN